MNKENYDTLKKEWKSVHLETDRLYIRNYIDSDEDGFLSIFQDRLCFAE